VGDSDYETEKASRAKQRAVESLMNELFSRLHFKKFIAIKRLHIYPSFVTAVKRGSVGSVSRSLRGLRANFVQENASYNVCITLQCGARGSVVG
jgi:hypothetical protein